MIGRFSRYIERDDRAMERFLDAIARGESEKQALERMNSDGSSYTMGTVRQLTRADDDFAKALRSARRGEGHEPHIWV